MNEDHDAGIYAVTIPLTDGRTTVDLNIRARDAFLRAAPVGTQVPEDWWNVMRLLVDHGAYLLGEHRILRAGQHLRDIVMAALTRRALVTTEGICDMLFRGLVEPAIVLHRVLVEIELNAKLVVADDTGQMVARLAAFHYRRKQRVGEQMLGDRATRDALQQASGAFDRIKRSARSLKEAFNSPTFDVIRDALASAQNWYGLDSIEEAFASVGASIDYAQTYAPSSLYVHSANPEDDLEALVEGSPRLKPLMVADLSRHRSLLAATGIRMLSVLTMFVEDKTVQQVLSDREHIELTEATGPLESIGALNNLLEATFPR